MAGSRLLRRTIVAALCLTALVAIGALLGGDFGETEGRIMLTTGAIGAYGLLGLPSGLLLERGRLRALAYADAGLAAAGFLLTLNIVWLQWDDAGDVSWKSWGVATILAGAVAQVAASRIRAREDEPPTVARLVLGSTIAACTLALLGVVAVLAEIDSSGYYRAVGTVAVLDVLLLVLVPIQRRAAPRPEPFRLVVRADGDEQQIDATGRDFAAAVASAIRDAERAGRRVTAVERR